MSIQVNKKYNTFTPSSGTVSRTFEFSSIDIRQLIITSATSSTTFDVILTNDNDVEVYKMINATGGIHELFSVPINGNCTLTVENASVDEVFTYYLSGIEDYA